MAAKKKNTNAKKATPPQTESKNRKQQKAGGLGSLPKWAGACIIAIVTFVAFSPSLQNRFVNFDDSGYLFSDTLVTSPTPDLKGMFTTQVLGNYHPLAIFSLWADHKLY
ncbi:MAG TPA: hypothetical protein VG603_16330, partial [Chitinophagales bacterium]|nr:hypothetical protein [Chitinophagales bacterium]